MSNGKGDAPRPMSIDKRTFDTNWERIFQTQKKKIDKQVQEVQEEINRVKEMLEQKIKVKENESISREEIGENGIG